MKAPSDHLSEGLRNRTDYLIIALYLAGILCLGCGFARSSARCGTIFWRGATTRCAFDCGGGDQYSPPLLACGDCLRHANFTFLQLVIDFGYVVGRVVISFVLLPHYFRGDLYTAYELIERRLGRWLRL